MLDATATLWKYSTTEGQKLYGKNYVAIEDLVAYHSLASNDIMCDEFHEGSGFLTHHLALGNVFENSVRAVDPSVIIPYWDFTIEGQEIKDKGTNTLSSVTSYLFISHLKISQAKEVRICWK
jgi:hypothetical protein